MSCPFCHRSLEPTQSGIVTRSQNGQYVPYPYPNTYGEPAIITGTTEEILKLRSGVIKYNQEQTRHAKGIYHWSNVPAGSEITSQFNKNFPFISGHQTKKPSVIPEDFPYAFTAPRVPPPHPQLNLNPQPAPRPVYVPAPKGNACCYQRGLGANGGRVQQAIQHIDAASRILKTY